MIITSKTTEINGVSYTGGVANYYANLRAQDGWSYRGYQAEMVLDWGVEPIPQEDYEDLLEWYMDEADDYTDAAQYHNVEVWACAKPCAPYRMDI